MLIVFAVPMSVTKVSVEAFGQSYVNLKWTKPSGLYSSFQVVYATLGQTPVTVDAGTLLQKETRGLSAGTKYTVTVFTLRGNDKSSGSSIDITTGDTHTYYSCTVMAEMPADLQSANSV